MIQMIPLPKVQSVGLVFAIVLSMSIVGCSDDNGVSVEEAVDEVIDEPTDESSSDTSTDSTTDTGNGTTEGDAATESDTATESDVENETNTGADTSVDSTTDTTENTETDAVVDNTEEAVDEATNTVENVVTTTSEGINFAHFLDGSIISEVAEVDCTLSNGDVTRCYQFEIGGEPLDHDEGPFCPRNISDGAEAGGKWLDNGVLVDLTGEFIANLGSYYGEGWLLHDPATGLINVTDTAESCRAAAQLNPPQEYWNHCIECTIENFGGPVPIVVTIPIVPVPRAATGPLDNVFPGVSLNGVGLSFPADLDGIVATFNIAALDDCAGHVNNAASYHYHGATGCWHEIPQSEGHAALIGYAMDGYGIHSMTNLDGGEPTDLDECRGHTDDVRGYHYHAASAGENMFIGCYHGEVVEVQGGGGPGGRPRG